MFYVIRKQDDLKNSYLLYKGIGGINYWAHKPEAAMFADQEAAKQLAAEVGGVVEATSLSDAMEDESPILASYTPSA